MLKKANLALQDQSGACSPDLAQDLQFSCAEFEMRIARKGRQPDQFGLPGIDRPLFGRQHLRLLYAWHAINIWRRLYEAAYPACQVYLLSSRSMKASRSAVKSPSIV